MRELLKSLFSIYGETVEVLSVNGSIELFQIITQKHGTYYVCAKELTFGGRENLEYEQRIQIKGSSNNYIEEKISQGQKGLLLGIIKNDADEYILCTFKVKHSTAQNTISKQIKNETLNRAMLNGFAQQLKDNEYACAFRRELLYFYLSNTDWIHDDRLRNLNNYVEPVLVDEQDNCEEELEERRLPAGSNVLLYGVPGSGKSWTIEHEYCKSDSVVERLVFHPDYTNADFIGQILPVVDEEKQVSYEFTPGPFTSIMKEAYWHPEKEYILIIEEINRGNAPAIFGEVFQLLDRKVSVQVDDGYPIGTSEYGITHKYMAEEIYNDAKHKVKIPSNLSILGTMNTSDQNVFTLDTAFQRRWRMRLIENNFNNVRTSLAEASILDTGITWKRFCETINSIIIGNKAKMASAEDKRLGVYFIHENDVSFDNRVLPTSAYETLTAEYNDLVSHETLGDITDSQLERLSEIREAVMHNRVFPEKVIKYLWDDAFKFNPEALFDTDNMDSLEKVIRTFVFSKGSDRFKVFKQTVRDLLYTAQ